MPVARKKITALTDEQLAAMPEFVNRYVKLGTCTDPIDRSAIRQIIDPLYRMLGRKPPVAIVVMDGPLHAWYATTLLSQVLSQVDSQVRLQVLSQVRLQVLSQVLSQVRLQVLSQVLSQVDSQVLSQVDSQVRSQVLSQVRSQVRLQVLSQVDSQVDSQVLSQVRSQVRSQVDSQVDSQVLSQVLSQVRSQVRLQVLSQVDSQVRSQVRSFIWPHLSGQLWASYFSWVDFYEYIGVAPPAAYSVVRRTADLSLIYPLDEFCVLSERLARASLRDGRLHCEDGPAIAYRDGLEVWAIGGVKVNEQIVLRPHTQKVAELDHEVNAEVKRVRIERFGWPKYLRAKKAKVVDHRRNDIEQTDESLMRCDNMTVFVGACPSTARVYALEVDPSCRTVEQAQNFLNGGRTRRIVGAT